jgi:hypothetical protein
MVWAMEQMRALLAGLCLGLITTSALASSDSDPGSSSSRAPKLPVEGRNGSFTRVIPIDIPAFRGIDPELRLVYDSTSGLRNLPAAGAEFGVGWSLQGVSAIQRVSGTPAPAAGQNKRPSGRGAPAYGATGFAADSFLLDGTELIACTEVPAPAATPSCANAGGPATAFTSRIETYLRIRQNVSTNSWEVTERDGVKSTYTSLEAVPFGQTYRWLLASVTDRRGNRVDYGWSCEADHCTIASIRAYTQGSASPASEVLFHTEVRPDPITYGIGRGIRTMARRITAIEVRSAGLRQAAYALTYETSKSTKLSRLTEVRKFGSDASISGSAVTGGTSLPPWRMSYSDNGDAEGRPAFTKREDWSGPGVEAIQTDEPPNFMGIPLPYPSTAELVGDFNGDGWATDHYLPKLCVPAKIYWRQPNCISTDRNTCSGGIHHGYICAGGRLRLANGNPAVSSFAMLQRKTRGKLPRSSNIVALGDFDGDGAIELARADSIPSEHCANDDCPRSWAYNGVTSMNLDEFRGDGFHSLTHQHKPRSAAGMAGDFNGDGKDDFLLVDGRILLSGRGGGVRNWGLERINNFRKDYRFLLGDVNGDGLADVLINRKTTQTYRIYLSTGGGLVAQPSFNLPANTSRRSLGDVNGDGLADLIYSNSDGIRVLFSDGHNLSSASGLPVSASVAQQTRSSSSGFLQFRMGDFNGDGRVDIVGAVGGNTSTGSGVARSIGTGFQSFPGVLQGQLSTTVVADYNGDGADDLSRAQINLPIGVEDPRRQNNHIWLSTSGQADLMTSFQEPLGGLVSVTYGASARETASPLPFIMQVVKSLTLDDGRGGVSTLNFAYEGGLW